MVSSVSVILITSSQTPLSGGDCKWPVKEAVHSRTWATGKSSKVSNQSSRRKAENPICLLGGWCSVEIWCKASIGYLFTCSRHWSSRSSYSEQVETNIRKTWRTRWRFNLQQMNVVVSEETERKSYPETPGKAYHQRFVGEKSRHLSAFITPWALYEWTRIPFALINS